MFQERGGDRIPSSDGLDDKGLEENSLRTAMLKVRMVPWFDGGGDGFGGARQKRFLRGGNDAYVKGYSSPIGPVRNTDDGGAGVKARHDTR